MSYLSLLTLNGWTNESSGLGSVLKPFHCSIWLVFSITSVCYWDVLTLSLSLSLQSLSFSSLSLSFFPNPKIPSTSCPSCFFTSSPPTAGEHTVSLTDQTHTDVLVFLMLPELRSRSMMNPFFSSWSGDSSIYPPVRAPPLTPELLLGVSLWRTSKRL